MLAHWDGRVEGKGAFTIYALELFEFLTIFHCHFCASLLTH